MSAYLGDRPGSGRLISLSSHYNAKLALASRGARLDQELTVSRLFELTEVAAVMSPIPSGLASMIQSGYLSRTVSLSSEILHITRVSWHSGLDVAELSTACEL